MIVELRIYHCAPSRLPALNDRFTNHTLGFFKKHGIEQIGLWSWLVGPSDRSQTYLQKWDSVAEGEQKWNAFRSDPVWIATRAASEPEKIIVERVEHQFVAPTAYSAVK